MTGNTKSLKDKIVGTVAANIKYIVGGLVLVAVVWGGFVAHGTYTRKQEMKAQNDLFLIDSEFDKKQQELAGDGKKAPEKTPETLTKNYGSLIERYESFIASRRGTKASMVAAITLADLYLDHKEAAKAVAVLEPALKETRSSELFHGLLSSQLGLALSDAGQCDKALEIYEQVLKTKSQSAFHSQVLLRQGACFVTLKRYDEAKAVFEKARTEYPGSFTGEMAQGYERLIALMKNTGGQ